MGTLHPPQLLPYLFNLCLDSSVHPWKMATIVMVNKPQKPNYSVPKAYQPITLMECTGKLLKRIVAKRFNSNIQQFGLLPMSQFGS
jgi:hypothetical protein